MKYEKFSSIRIIICLLVTVILLLSYYSEPIGDMLFSLVLVIEKAAILGFEIIIKFLKKSIVIIFPILCIILTYYSYSFINISIPKTYIEFEKSKQNKTLNRFYYESSIKVLKRIAFAVKSLLFFVVSIVYTYGYASTGNKITKLFGVARKNALVALFGGGAKASGGGGMELGYKVLIVIFLYALIWDHIRAKGYELITRIRK